MLKTKSIKKSNLKGTLKPRIIVVMPAFNAEKTLEKTVNDYPKNLVYKTILVDDKSTDKTVTIAKKLGLTVYVHPNNLGYGGNQKTCYWEALKEDPDIVVMIHPDYQYDSRLITELVRPIIDKRYDMMFGNRIRTRQDVLQGGMPKIKYYLNRIYCIFENIVLGANFSEYFSGMRAYSADLLRSVPFQRFSNDFVFDQELLISAYATGYKIGEINIPVRYFSEASSIRFFKGAKYLIETMTILLKYMLFKMHLFVDPMFKIPHADAL